MRRRRSLATPVLFSTALPVLCRREAVISHFGHFLLKGLDEPKLILQVCVHGTPCASLITRHAKSTICDLLQLCKGRVAC